MVSLRLVLFLLFTLSSCAAPMANGEQESLPDVAADNSAQASPAAGNPAELLRCQQACRDGRTAVEAFCRSVPDPRIKSACWGFALVGVVACLNFCYNYWGS